MLTYALTYWQKKDNLQAKQFFARRMEAKTRAWTQITTLRLCHHFGSPDASPLCKLPVELEMEIEEAIMVLEHAPTSITAMIESWEADHGRRNAETNVSLGLPKLEELHRYDVQNYAFHVRRE